MSLNFGNEEIILYVKPEDKTGEIIAKEPDYNFQIEILKVSEDEIMQEKIVTFLENHLLAVRGDWTMKGEKPDLKNLKEWPISIVNSLVTQYTEAFKKLSGVEEDKVKKK